MDRIKIDAEVGLGEHGSGSYLAILTTIERNAEAFDLLMAQYQRGIGGAWDTIA